MMKRITLLLVILATLVASALAQVGGRFAPKGTFTGDPSVLRSIASGKPAIHTYYTQILGAGWDQPGALEVQGQPTQIPVGALVPGNALLMRDGTVRPCSTIEGRTDRRGDTGYYVFNNRSGRGHWIKSCGQGFRDTPPEKPEIPVYETDFETKIDIDLTFKFEVSASAEAEANATANARGGNAVVYMPPAMPQYIPRRELARATTEMYNVATLSWVAVPRMTQNNNQTQQQQQQQQQWQQQWQQQLQEMQQFIDLWIKNHGGG